MEKLKNDPVEALKVNDRIENLKKMIDKSGRNRANSQ